MLSTDKGSAKRTARLTFDNLLEVLELSGDGVSIEGDDPAIASPHRASGAMAAAIGAQAAAIMEIWRRRGGDRQTARVEVGRASHALCSGRYLTQNGFPLDWSFSPPLAAYGLFKAGDGRWVSLSGFRPQFRDGILDVLEVPHSRTAIGEAIAGWDAEGLEAEAARRRLPLAPSARQSPMAT